MRLTTLHFQVEFVIEVYLRNDKNTSVLLAEPLA